MSDALDLPEGHLRLYKSPPFVLDHYPLSSLILSSPPHLLISFIMSFANISVADILGLNNRVGSAPGTLVCLRGSPLLFLVILLVIFYRMTSIQRRLCSGINMVSWRTNWIKMRSSRL